MTSVFLRIISDNKISYKTIGEEILQIPFLEKTCREFNFIFSIDEGECVNKHVTISSEKNQLAQGKQILRDCFKLVDEVESNYKEASRLEVLTYQKELDALKNFIMLELGEYLEKHENLEIENIDYLFQDTRHSIDLSTQKPTLNPETSLRIPPLSQTQTPITSQTLKNLTKLFHKEVTNVNRVTLDHISTKLAGHILHVKNYLRKSQEINTTYEQKLTSMKKQYQTRNAKNRLAWINHSYQHTQNMQTENLTNIRVLEEDYDRQESALKQEFDSNLKLLRSNAHYDLLGEKRKAIRELSKAEKIQDYYIGVIEGMRKKVVEIQSLEQEIYKEKLEQFSDKYSEKLENSNLRMRSVEKSRKIMS